MAGTQYFTVGASTPVGPINNPVVVTNTNTSGTLYVGSSSVTSSSNDFSIAAGASRVVYSPNRYLIGSVGVGVLIRELDEAVAPQGAFPERESIFTNRHPASLTEGTDSTPSATEVYFQRLYIPAPALLTGVQYLIGSVGGTDKAIAILYDAKGNVLANHTTAGTTVGTLATYQQLAFTSPYQVPGPGIYHVGLSFNGNTARYRALPAGGSVWANKATGQTFGTLTAITPPTAATTSAPILSTY